MDHHIPLAIHHHIILNCMVGKFVVWMLDDEIIGRYCFLDWSGARWRAWKVHPEHWSCCRASCHTPATSCSNGTWSALFVGLIWRMLSCPDCSSFLCSKRTDRSLVGSSICYCFLGWVLIRRAKPNWQIDSWSKEAVWLLQRSVRQLKLKSQFAVLDGVLISGWQSHPHNYWSRKRFTCAALISIRRAKVENQTSKVEIESWKSCSNAIELNWKNVLLHQPIDAISRPWLQRSHWIEQNCCKWFQARKVI